MTTAPGLTVLMPVRNGGHYLAPACASVLAQQGAAFEFLIVDDGSDDATPALLSALAASDPRVRVLGQSASGLVAALNRGVHAARAPLIARMDADDLSLPGRFARQLAHLEAHPQVAALGTGWRTIDAASAVTGMVAPPQSASAVRKALMRRNCLAHPSVMFRRETVLRLGGYREALTGAEDYDLWARLSQQADVENLPAPLIALRQHPHQSTRRRLEQRILAEIGCHWLHRRRLEGPEPSFDVAAQLDRAGLAAIGMTQAEISAGIVARALGAAIDALRGGDAATARVAAALVLAERPRWRTRLHAMLLTIRARARR